MTLIAAVVEATARFTLVYNSTNGSLQAVLFLHTTFNLSIPASAVLDTDLGYLFVLGVFILAAAVVLGVFG